jgi:hypothetical protein
LRSRFLRAVGAATFIYGVAVSIRPELLARPSGLVDEQGEVSAATIVSLRPVGWRDAVSGAAMVLAPAGAPLRLAAVVRMGADFGDALLLGTTLPDRNRRRFAVAISVGWGAVSLIGLFASERKRAAN